MEVLADVAIAKKRKRITTGVVLFWGVLVSLIAGAIAITGMYARSGYFLGFNSSDHVVVYRGQVGGLLWFEPTVDTETELTGSELPDDVLRDVALNRTFTSSSLARQFLSLVQIAIVDASTTTTTTLKK
jgi:hypothetical protein